MNQAFSAALCALILAGILMMWVVRPDPYASVIAEDAALLYYNSPAAVQTPFGIAVGYITSAGAVDVTLLGDQSKTITVHQYDRTDDHAAPALWWNENRLFVATAFHGSELFLYAVDLMGDARLVCRWPGRYTYPRFAQDAQGLKLLARNQREPRIGDLVSFSISGSCARQEVLAQAQENQILYAAAPVDENILWSIYDLGDRRHETIWLNGVEQHLPTDDIHDQTLAWSSVGDLVSISRFSANFGLPGAYKAEVYKAGNLVLALPATPTRYYPSGIVLSDQGSALAPKGESLVKIDVQTMDALPSCATRRIASRGQFVVGGDGAYVFVEHRGSYHPKKLWGARVVLCDMRNQAESR